ncbi:hypothetical protein OGATHE_004156 [Ogataea polymorpha]|uniref:Uncharacterized protein n=1 Tax=Ogataea polymorpha TaxID=460523 RepID=A0A9P8P4Z2_9ASCO|nr:hypothetical protein OGATHE_004156 [Ogataea polymorpha]
MMAYKSSNDGWTTDWLIIVQGRYFHLCTTTELINPASLIVFESCSMTFIGKAKARFQSREDSVWELTKSKTALTLSLESNMWIRRVPSAILICTLASPDPISSTGGSSFFWTVSAMTGSGIRSPGTGEPRRWPRPVNPPCFGFGGVYDSSIFLITVTSTS